MTTNTQPLAPTDAEIDAVLCSNWPAFYRKAPLVRMWLRDAVREAIAKWGQPAHSGEPVAWLDPWTGAKVTTDYDAYGKHGIPLYTAPQPVEREPLTDAQIRAMAREHPAEDLCGWSYRMGIADTERHHGIKGGQHGAE